MLQIQGVASWAKRSSNNLVVELIPCEVLVMTLIPDGYWFFVLWSEPLSSFAQSAVYIPHWKHNKKHLSIYQMIQGNLQIKQVISYNFISGSKAWFIQILQGNPSFKKQWGPIIFLLQTNSWVLPKMDFWSPCNYIHIKLDIINLFFHLFKCWYKISSQWFL